MSRGVGGDQPGPGTAIAFDRRTAALVVDAVADAVGELFDGFDEADVLLLLQEAVDIAPFPAPEAVEMPVVGADVE